MKRVERSIIIAQKAAIALEPLTTHPDEWAEPERSINRFLICRTAESDDLQKRQTNGDPCGSGQVDNCQQALNSDDNDRFCDGDCEEVLTDYYHCKGFAEFRLYQNQECGAMATGLGPLLLVTALPWLQSSIEQLCSLAWTFLKLTTIY